MKTLVKFAFRIVIDKDSAHPWDKLVFGDTYTEYRIQHQAFAGENKDISAYWQLLKHQPEAKKIPFLLASAAANYIAQLDGEIRSLPDVLGDSFFEFSDWKLDLISSDLNNRDKHKIGITFYTPKLQLIDIIDSKYLISKDLSPTQGAETIMMPFHPQMSICWHEKISD